MAINDINSEEDEYLIQALAAKRDWPNVVEEILSSSSTMVRGQRRKNYSSDDDSNGNSDETNSHVENLKIEKTKAVECLEFLDEKHFPIDFLWKWMVLVFREVSGNGHGCNDENEARTGSTNDSTDEVARPHLQTQNLLIQLSTYGNDIEIALISAINTLLVCDTRTLPSKIEAAEQAHMIQQILQNYCQQLEERNDNGSITAGVQAFDNHIQNDDISRFWNHVFQCDTNQNKNMDAVLLPKSSVWGDLDDRRTKVTNPEDIEHIIAAGDQISGHILTAAELAQIGLEKYVAPTVSKGITAVGKLIINNTESFNRLEGENENEDSTSGSTVDKDVDVKDLVNLTDASVQTTDSIRRGAETAAFGVRDFSTRKIHDASEAWKEMELGRHIIPDDDVRETVVATGKVGMATLGAAALLTESIFNTTKAIAQTSVDVASQVANHKYGEDAGKLVKNTGVTSGNVLRTITHVGMLEAQVLTKVIVKNTAKIEMQEAKDDASQRSNEFLVLKKSGKNEEETPVIVEDGIPGSVDPGQPQRL